MDNETGVQNSLHTLIPLTDFKAILGIDDREDKISVFCLITTTYTIEQYCLRRLVKKIVNEQLAMSNGDLLLPLREYPVREVVQLRSIGIWGIGNGGRAISNEQLGMSNEGIVEPECYQVIPDLEEGEGLPEDMPYCLSLSPALSRVRGFGAVKVIYRAGYACGEVPPNLASACLELAAWNMSRYRGRRIGLTGNVRGSGKDGEHLEASMPENVRLLLEPYRRRTI